jgi:hypothetical protein
MGREQDSYRVPTPKRFRTRDVWLPADDGRDSDDVIRIGGVPYPQKKSQDNHGDEADHFGLQTAARVRSLACRFRYSTKLAMPSSVLVDTFNTSIPGRTA